MRDLRTKYLSTGDRGLAAKYRALLAAAAIGIVGLGNAAAEGPTRAEPPAKTFAPPAVPATEPDLRAAIRQVEKRGYRVESPDTYSASARLKVLIGKRPGAVLGADNQRALESRAFFFDHDRFVGTDSFKPSARVQLAWQNDDTVALQYVLYRQGDPLCCPSGGDSVVRFGLESGKLVALDPVPREEIRAPATSR